VIDTDPQANATLGLGIYPETIQRSIYQYYFKRCTALSEDITLSDYIVKTISGIDLVPSHLDLVGVESVLYQNPDRYYILKTGIESLKNKYDYILIDTPPSLGQFVLNAMIAADRSVVVFSPDTFALAGYNHLLLIISDISDMLGKKIRIDMALLNRWDLSGITEETFLGKLRKLFGKKNEEKTEGKKEIQEQMEKRITVEIPEVIKISEGIQVSQSIKQGIPLIVLSPDDPSLLGFKKAAHIIEQWRFSDAESK
jgi:chromosome partitioning protein